MVALNARERGSSLVEMLVVVAVTAALLGGTYALSRKSAAVASSALALPRLIDEARALAAASGDGATVVFTPIALPSGASAGFDVALYRNRPDAASSGSPAEPVLERTEHLAGTLATSFAGGQPFAIFISTAGTVSYAAWTPAAGQLGQEPLCTAPLTLILTAGPTTAAFQLPCDSARLGRSS
jgi:hypothetical protein